jgi:SSS family solute:Na+ symporter
LGFFWKKATSKAAITGIFFGVLMSILFDKFLPGWMGSDTLLYTAYPTASGSFEIPYLIQMGWVFCFTTLAIIIVSLLDVKGQKHENEITEDEGQFKLSNAHLAMAMLVLGVVIALYIKFW